MLSENREESESLGWSSPTHCFSPLKGILCHWSVGKETAPAQTNRPCVNVLRYSLQWCWCFVQRRKPCRMCHSTGKAPRRWPPSSHGTRARLSLGLQDCLPERDSTAKVWAHTGHTWCERGAAPSNKASSKNNAQSTHSLLLRVLKRGRVRVRVGGSGFEACSVFWHVTLEKSLNSLPHESSWAERLTS